MARQGRSARSPTAAVVTASGSGQCGAGIFSIITFVAIAAAALSGCHSGIPVADAFVARPTTPCSGKRASNLFTATAGQEAQAGFLEDAFNGEEEADGGGASAAATVVAAGACSIDDGQVRGPAEVLVYDTSLRGGCFSCFAEKLLCLAAFSGIWFEVASSTLCASFC